MQNRYSLFDNGNPLELDDEIEMIEEGVEADIREFEISYLRQRVQRLQAA